MAQFRGKELNGDTVAGLIKLLAQTGRLIEDVQTLKLRADQMEVFFKEFFREFR